MDLHPGGVYAITETYSVPDDAWYFELCLAADRQALLLAIIPDEDPAREPTVCPAPAGVDRDIPYEVMTWFMGEVDGQIRRSRAWMRLRPELVEVVHRLRQEYLGCVDDSVFPRVLAEVRSLVDEADLPVVLAEAFGRGPDGAACSPRCLRAAGARDASAEGPG